MPPSSALFHPDALRVIERRATAAAGGDPFALMQRAGAAGWRCLLEHWPQARRILVCCGPGNNGGDGYVLALHALQAGRDVRAVHLPAHAPRSELARRACDHYLAAGGRLDVLASPVDLDADVIVDAIFGIGFHDALDAPTRAMVDAINHTGVPVLALDVPSGVDAALGAVNDVAIRAACTLQFIAPTCGLATGAALGHAGVRSVDALGLDARAFEGVPVAASLLDVECLARWLPARAIDSHKGSNGHVACVGGEHGSGGAIVLCGHAALRSGAGLVSVATRSAHVAPLLASCAEAMAHAVESPQQLADAIDRADVIAIGPGLGQGEWGGGLLAIAMALDKPLVLDADALNLLAEQRFPIPADTIVTPHPGEAARLLGTTVAKVQADRFEAARALAGQLGCVVVLKGAGTIVGAPGRTPCVVATGNPGMAVGGMGDVLTGVIAALRAQGLAPFDAACCGALLHGAAGDAAAGEGGERGLLPSDLLPWLRRLANPRVRP